MTETLYDIGGMAVYLSGPVTGRDMGGVIEAFESARVKCVMLGARYVYSPVMHVNHKASHEEAMLECLANLVSRDGNDELPFFDVLLQLDQWNKSEGARLEAKVAKAVGIDCVSVHAIGGAE